MKSVETKRWDGDDAEDEVDTEVFYDALDTTDDLRVHTTCGDENWRRVHGETGKHAETLEVESDEGEEDEWHDANGWFGLNQMLPKENSCFRMIEESTKHFEIVEFATISSAYHEDFLKNLDLRKESERVRTFEHWPSERPTVYSADLARSGFFYLGNLDRVQCFSCGGVLRNWNYGDNVQAEHCRHFPHCKMCQGAESRNVQLTPDERAAVPSQQTVFPEPPDPSENEARDLRNSFNCQYPVSPHMRNEDTRFETFDHRWPASQVNATPRQIAGAGFFFLGNRDRVKCWYCNGGLQNWDPQDEPWTEHAKWFPSCEFLLKRKGPEFVHRMVSMFPNLPRPLLRGPHDVAPPNPGRRIQYGTASVRAPSPPPPINNPPRERQQIQDPMNSDIVMSVIEMGFDRKVVCHAVKRRIRRAAMCTTVAELVDDVTGNTSDVSDSDDEENENSMQAQPSTSAKTPGRGQGTPQFEVVPRQCSPFFENLANYNNTSNLSRRTTYLKQPQPLRSTVPCSGLGQLVHPHMQSTSARLESFRQGWSTADFAPTPKWIAEAGFFYLGEGDKVVCWNCNVTLQNWQRNMDPWSRHAMRSPRCQLLLQHKEVLHVNQQNPAHFFNPVPVYNDLLKSFIRELIEQAELKPREFHFSWIKQHLMQSFQSSTVLPDKIIIYRALHLVCHASLSVFVDSMQNAQTATDLHPALLLTLSYIFSNPSVVFDLKETKQEGWINDKKEVFKELLKQLFISKPQIRPLLLRCLKIIGK